MRDKHYEPGNNLQNDIEVCLTGAAHLGATAATAVDSRNM
jgi:hypothetical protein